MPASFVWQPGPNGGTPTNAANLNKLAVTADIGVAGTPTGDAGRAVFGPSVYASNLRTSLAHTTRADPPRPAMPTVSWGASSPTGMDKYNLLTLSGSTVVLTTTAPWARLVNCTTANAQINQTFWTVANGSNDTGTPGPLTLETQLTTDRLVLQLNPIADGGTLAQQGNIEVWVDDVPLFIPTGPTNSAHTPAFLSLAWATKGTHTVRLGLELVSPGDTYVSTGDPIAATTATSSIRLAVLGDSWTEGTSFGPLSFARLLPRYLGIDDAAVCGQGGTGYTATGGGNGKSVYGSTGRVNALVANNPTDVVVFGTINDNSATPSAIQTAATALYSTLATRLPSARLFVVLPQPAGATDAASASHIANREAVRTAAAAAANVRTVIDPSDWLTGTGWSTSRTGDGNRDLYIGPDNTHPTPAGHDYFARRLAEILCRWLYV